MDLSELKVSYVSYAIVTRRQMTIHAGRTSCIYVGPLIYIHTQFTNTLLIINGIIHPSKKNVIKIYLK